MERIVDEVRKMLIEHPEIDESKTMMVNFNQFGGSSVDFFLYCFTNTTQWIKFHQVKQEIMLLIAEIIAAHQAEIAFPTSTIHIADPVTLENA